MNAPTRLAQYERHLIAMHDGYPERNRQLLDNRIRQCRADIGIAREEGNTAMVEALGKQIEYYRAAKANNDGHPFRLEGL